MWSLVSDVLDTRRYELWTVVVFGGSSSSSSCSWSLNTDGEGRARCAPQQQLWLAPLLLDWLSSRMPMVLPSARDYWETFIGVRTADFWAGVLIFAFLRLVCVGCMWMVLLGEVVGHTAGHTLSHSWTFQLLLGFLWNVRYVSDPLVNIFAAGIYLNPSKYLIIDN